MELIKKTLSEKKRIFIPMLILAFVFFLSFLFYFSLKTSAQNISGSKSVITSTTQNLSKLPVRIKIPVIKVDTIIEHVGLTKDGRVDSPTGPNNVAWWNGGPIPGAIGNAIIDGHSGWKNNIPAVFDNLKNLKKGDEISIENEAGIITTFVVRELKIYGKNDTALDVFNSTDNKSHLNLITCAGLWNIVERGSDDRIVVFTDLAEK